MNSYEFGPETTPEKIHLVLKAILEGNNNKDSLEKLLAPSFFGNSNIHMVIKMCEKMDLIINYKDELRLNFDPKYLINEVSFSYFIGNVVLMDEKFLNVVNYFINNFENIMKFSIKELLGLIPPSINKVSERYLLGFRFWFQYIGLGYYTQDRFIIFPFERIMLIINHDLKVNKAKYPAEKFIKMLQEFHPEIELFIEGKQLNPVLSECFILLRDRNIIELKYVPDSNSNVIIMHGNIPKEYSEIEIK